MVATSPAAGPAVQGRFPPPDVEPPSPKSAASGDGHWTPIGNLPGERGGGDTPLVVRTTVHTHPESRWIAVHVAAIDLGRAALRFVPGTEDLAWAKLPVGPTAGLVPAEDHEALVLVMNGGFQPKHGRWGMVSGPINVTPPREGACTVAIELGGRGVRIGSWAGLADDRANLEVVRQTPPCLLEGGAVHPHLLAGRDKPWAGQKADLKTRRRSAIGLDADRRILFYALGEEAEPRWLAEGLKVAGASNAAQLDINWYWTRFLLFGTDGDGVLRVTSTLIPKTEHHTRGYVQRASTRDFFYVVRTHPDRRQEPAPAR